MTRQDYLEQITADVLTWIDENMTAEELAEYQGDHDKLREFLNDELWIDDSVTGNASGSYTCDAYEAAQNLDWDGLEVLFEAADELCENLGELTRKGPETCDVYIRCYLLSEAISGALDQLEELGKI